MNPEFKKVTRTLTNRAYRSVKAQRPDCYELAVQSASVLLGTLGQDLGFNPGERPDVGAKIERALISMAIQAGQLELLPMIPEDLGDD
jgi:hypothetical protein